MSETTDLLAVDVGSSRVKLGWFPRATACETDPATSHLPIAVAPLPQPTETCACRHRGVAVTAWTALLTDWISELPQPALEIAVASVNPEVLPLVVEALAGCKGHTLKNLTAGDVPLDVQVKEPERVGMDRLLNALAANQIRVANQGALIIDMGTAVTIDLVGDDGAFLGGAILPGWSLAAASLHDASSALPLLSPDSMQLPQHGLGKCTTEALAAGITYGLCGAVEKLVAKYHQFVGGTPQLFLTGGDAPLVLDLLQENWPAVRHMPHLVLAGIAIASEENGDFPSGC